jgi:[ribosomal protein S18]-alanine N-acetyltransferase
MSNNSESLQVHLRPMTLADLNQVELIDRVSFPTPWPRDAFHYELKRNRSSICWVAECANPEGGLFLVGSIVVWLVMDEAHVATLAIKPGFRQRGVAQVLLASSLLESLKWGATRAMLEVRAGNQAAQNLYRKFGFEAVGLRQDYYKDTHEDAILMTLEQLDEEKLAQLADHG